MEIYKHLYAMDWVQPGTGIQHVVLTKESIISYEDELMYWYLGELKRLRLNVT